MKKKILILKDELKKKDSLMSANSEDVDSTFITSVIDIITKIDSIAVTAQML